VACCLSGLHGSHLASPEERLRAFPRKERGWAVHSRGIFRRGLHHPLRLVGGGGPLRVSRIGGSALSEKTQTLQRRDLTALKEVPSKRAAGPGS